MGSRADSNPKPRSMVWSSEAGFQGWICDHCEWNYPLPTLLNDPEARSAYDRLAAGKFREHACENHLARLKGSAPASFTARIQKMVAHGYKPKDAVDLLMQEVLLEHRNEPKVLEQARSEGEDFLRRVRAGLI